MKKLQRALRLIQEQMHAVVEPSVEAGVLVHVAFLIDGLLKGEPTRRFKDLPGFVKKYRLENDLVTTNLMPLEKEFDFQIPEDEIAFLTQMLLENKLQSPFTFTQNISV